MKANKARRYKLKKGDSVRLLSGDDKGRTGKILKMYPRDEKAVVQGVNIVKMHRKATRDNMQGGIEEKESPVSVSKLVLVCPKCNKTTRVGYIRVEDGGLARICRKCKEMVDA